MADSLIIKIDGDASAYQKELKKVKDSVGEVNKIAKSVAIGVGVVGSAVVGIGVNFNAQMEQYKAGLTTLLGSAEHAEKTLTKLRDYAAKTPFEITDLAQASNVLLAYGENAENLMDDLKMLGDISLGNKEKFQGLALVFGQVQAQGRLMGQDLLQMVNNGFNPLQIISEKTGESMTTLKDRMSQGQISFEMVAEAMKTATAEGGRFYGAMDKQSKTLTGQISTLKDNVNALFGSMTESLSEPLSEEALPWLIEQVEELNAAWEEGRLQEYIKGAAIALAMFGSAVVALNLVMFIEDIYQLKKGTEGFTAATKLGTTAQKLFNLELLKNPYVLAATALAALVAGIVTYAATHKSAAEEIKDSLKDIQKEYDSTIQSIDDAASAEMAEAETVLALRDRLCNLEGQIKSGTLTQEEAEQAQHEFNAAASQLESMIPGITSLLYDETGAINVQTGAVNGLTNAYYQLAYAKAMSNAYQAKMDAAASALVKAKEQQKNAELEVADAEARAEKAKNSSSNSIMGGASTYTSLGLTNAQNNLKKANEEVGKYESELNGYIAEMTHWSEEHSKLSETMKDENEDTTKAVTSGNTAKIASNKSAAEERKKLAEAEYRAIKREHENGIASDKEYYHKLAEIRNEYFDEGSDEWEEYTDEIFDYYRDVLTKASEEVNKKIDELKDKKNDLAKSLNDENYFITYTLTDRDGEKRSSVLIDNGLEQDKEYLSLITWLEERYGEDSDTAKTVKVALRNMDAKKGIEFLKTIQKDANRFQNALGWWEEKKNIDLQIADKLYDPEDDALIQKFEEVFGQVPEGFFDIGEESAKQYGEGFMGQLKTILAEVQTMISENMASLSGQFVLAGAGAGTSTSYTDARSTTINVSSDTSGHAVVEAMKQQEIYEEHTKKVGG